MFDTRFAILYDFSTAMCLKKKLSYFFIPKPVVLRDTRIP